MNIIESLSDAGLAITDSDLDTINGGIFLISPFVPWVVVKQILTSLL